MDARPQSGCWPRDWHRVQRLRDLNPAAYTRQLQKYWDTPVTLTHALALTGVLGRKPPYPLKYPLARSSIPLPNLRTIQSMLGVPKSTYSNIYKHALKNAILTGTRNETVPELVLRMPMFFWQGFRHSLTKYIRNLVWGSVSLAAWKRRRRLSLRKYRYWI